MAKPAFATKTEGEGEDAAQYGNISAERLRYALEQPAQAVRGGA